MHLKGHNSENMSIFFFHQNIGAEEGVRLLWENFIALLQGPPSGEIIVGDYFTGKIKISTCGFLKSCRSLHLH